MEHKTRQVKEFYDEYWPENVRNYPRTREHVLSVLPDVEFESALDAGCGTGVCALSLSERANKVTAVDISSGGLRVARELAQRFSRPNIDFVQANLLALPFPDESFDLVFSWGVIDHITDPYQALNELVRVLQPGGTLILTVYLKTNLTWVHESLRKMCLHLPTPARRAFIHTVAGCVSVAERVGKNTNVRDDNPSIASQVENWFFVPHKHFFTVDEMQRLFERHHLSFELLCEQTGRFKSSSKFIVRGTKAHPSI